MGGGKRKRFDEKLTDATRALKHLDSAHATDGDELASGALELVPFPGVRLRGEAADLPLPLTPDAAHTIVQKARASKKTDEPRWEIQSQDAEVLNPRWRAFVNKIAGDVREPLGISQAARVHATLNKLVLVRPGGRLPVERGEERVQRGVFGTLVVVLPGAFTGGATSVRRDGEPVRPPLQWQPGHADRPVYGVTYTAFYNNSTAIETLPITSGEALCLVYDLVTTTIHEVPRTASLPVLHQALEASLAQFFELLPSHKRFKLSDDAWRTINEFAVDRRFVYPVTGDSFESLQDDDQRIAERLAAFCEHSNGQYVLYLAALSCTRQSCTRDDSVLDATCAVALHPPWFKHGEARELPFPVMTV